MSGEEWQRIERHRSVMFALGGEGRLFVAGPYPSLFEAKGAATRDVRKMLQKALDDVVLAHPAAATPRRVKGTSYPVVLFRGRLRRDPYLQVQLGGKQYPAGNLTEEQITLLTSLELDIASTRRLDPPLDVSGEVAPIPSASPTEFATQSAANADETQAGSLVLPEARAARDAAQAAQAAAFAAKAAQLAAEAAAKWAAEAARVAAVAALAVSGAVKSPR